MMSRVFRLSFAVAAALLCAGSPISARAAATVSTADIGADLHATTQAQIAALQGRAPIDWVAGTMWAGMAEYGRAAHDPIADASVRAMGEAVAWTPHVNPANPYNADDECIAQTFLDEYDATHDPKQLAPAKLVFDSLADHLSAAPHAGARLTWWWCDALFMAPAGLAHLSAITGDHKYLDAMDAEYWRTAAALYNPKDRLFYRDARFFNRKSPNGLPIYWSRGNGWVIAGLARILTYLPKDYPSRPKYETLYQDMAAKIATLQGPDGLWRANLLDPEAFPGPESSGTGFYTYALAWGVNNGLLDRATYLPIIAKGWAGLCAARQPSGLPGYGQPGGDSPATAPTTATQVFATGAFLLAGTELIKLAPIPAVPAPSLPVVVGPRPAPKKAMAKFPAPAQPLPGARAFVRYVPERYDDIAWENDRIAYRVYGPALAAHPGDGPESGQDVWVKSTRRMVINDWYKRGDYHIDHGEGMDMYEVGPSRGCGGIGVWDGGKLSVALDWVSYKILENGPDVAKFQMSFAPYSANGRTVTESRVTSLAAGSNLNRIETTLTSDQPGQMIVAIGIAKRKGQSTLTQDRALGLLAYWEPESPKKGAVGCGVLADPKLVTGYAEDALNYYVLIKATPGVPFVYFAGACWSKGLDFHSNDEWVAYLKSYPRN
jgi:rhamnogalacturonyl hydrolase YesR